MNTIALLQLSVLALASRMTAGQESIFFPGDPINETSPMLPTELRSASPPINCKMRAGQDEDSPCLDDLDYNENLKNHVEFLLADSNLNSIVRDPLFKQLLNDEMVEVRTRPLSTRLGVSETPVCQSEETLIFPKRAKSASNDWVFVLNHENVEQALRVEKCINEGSPCEFESPLPSEVRTVCRQKYVYRRMLTVGTNKIQPEEVLMPSCCVCYRKNAGFDIGSRTRVPGQPAVGQPVGPPQPFPNQPFPNQPFPNSQPGPVQPTSTSFNQPILAPAINGNFGNQPAPPFNHRTIRRGGFVPMRGGRVEYFNNWH
ncbi:protein spaetzle-like isoform X2 [Penaeus japonicus]|uniref:protein spaetzle-like isoform X2 n=1 Tax=Penaeus japonicus TaxID=27405 RepID=UPI001C712D58|nr:protein spaetzle-like isoform X2 [Penaeus japonicus]